MKSDGQQITVSNDEVAHKDQTVVLSVCHGFAKLAADIKCLEAIHGKHQRDILTIRNTHAGLSTVQLGSLPSFAPPHETFQRHFIIQIQEMQSKTRRSVYRMT